MQLIRKSSEARSSLGTSASSSIRITAGCTPDRLMPCVFTAVHPAVDGEPLQDDDPPAVVGTRDQLTDADAAELPITRIQEVHPAGRPRRW